MNDNEAQLRAEADAEADRMEAHAEYRSEFGSWLPGNEPVTFEEWLDATDEDELDETDVCPTHGRENVTGTRSTGGPDPYGVDELACGCDVVCYGPGEPNVVIRATGKRRTGSVRHQADLENGPSERDFA